MASIVNRRVIHFAIATRLPGVYYTNMSPKASLIIHDKDYDIHGNIVEIRLWSVPVEQERPLGFKYSLAYIVEGQRVVGYDNERGKGDHKHIDGVEYDYLLVSLQRLKVDFHADVTEWKGKKYGHQS